ncbi:MAG: hypothetical protein WDM91_10965 [Rhizomicrobium sp.]
MAERGRPPKEPTPGQRGKVQELLGAGAKIAKVAKLFDLSVPTFRKYFSAEILAVKKIAEAAKAGQSSFKPTKTHRDDVAFFIGCNMKPVDVARAIGCTEDELRQHFPDELATGKALARAEVLRNLRKQMVDDGLVGATNRLEALTQIVDLEAPPASAAPGYVGKKVAARADAAAAVAAGGRFAPRPAPKLAAVNGEAVVDDVD